MLTKKEVIPVNFYVDEEDEEDSDFVDEDDFLVSDENDFDDNVIFDEKDGDVEVEIKVINEKEASDSEETETINLEEV